MNASLTPGTLGDIRAALTKAEKAWARPDNHQCMALCELRNLLGKAEQFAWRGVHTEAAKKERGDIAYQWACWRADYGPDL